jgi:hypothetical protein
VRKNGGVNIVRKWSQHSEERGVNIVRKNGGVNIVRQNGGVNIVRKNGGVNIVRKGEST